ncbi:MAG: hypothetical protein JW942_08410 [Opitutales bacterium]|nr:hypothetical protein [Opitutales bacterium]
MKLFKITGLLASSFFPISTSIAQEVLTLDYSTHSLQQSVYDASEDINIAVSITAAGKMPDSYFQTGFDYLYVKLIFPNLLGDGYRAEFYTHSNIELSDFDKNTFIAEFDGSAHSNDITFVINSPRSIDLISEIYSYEGLMQYDINGENKGYHTIFVR